MECVEARKKLKEYAAGEIENTEERLQVEAHVAGCPVCKRELLMWQEVLDKQRAVSRMQAGMPTKFKDRIKYRMAKNQKQADMPPALKKIQSFAKGKGSLIMVFILICVALLFIFRTAGFKSTILGPMLIFSGFAILFLLMLFRDNNKP